MLAICTFPHKLPLYGIVLCEAGQDGGNRVGGCGVVVVQTPVARGSLSSGTSPISTSGSGVQIERLILHGLDNHNHQLRLVDAPVELDEAGEAFFAHYAGWAHEHADWNATFVEPGGEVAALCGSLLGSDDDFVAASRALARRLFDRMQSRAIAPGDFVAATYVTGESGLRHIALLKLDPDRRLARKFTRSGKHMRAEIRPASNLLPDPRRLQKCAILPVAGTAPSGDILLLDTQAGPRANSIAAFFYRDFLATCLAPSPRRLRQIVIRAIHTWMTQWGDQLAPSELMTFYSTLRAAVDSGMIEIDVFARTALPARPALQTSLAGQMRSALRREYGDPAFSTDRLSLERSDAALLTGKITIELDGGAKLVVSAERFDELVQIAPERTSDNKCRVIIESLTLREVYDR